MNQPKNQKTNAKQQNGFFKDFLGFFHNESSTQKEKEKKTLVLDIDETLVHSSAENPSKGYDFNVSTVVSGAVSKLYVKKRPGLDNFLAEMSQYFEIYTYTSSMKEYSDQIVENIDPTGKLIKRSLCRHNCVYANGVYIKDLSKLKKKLKDVVIVDNSKTAFLLHKPNGILIAPFFDDPNDIELKRLMGFLKFLSNVYDVRPAEEWRKTFSESSKIEYLDQQKSKQLFLYEVSPRSRREESNFLCSFANLKKEVEKIALYEFEDLEEEEFKKNKKDFSSNSPELKKEHGINGRCKTAESNNSFFKIKKDFNEKKSKIIKSSSNKMTFMHDC